MASKVAKQNRHHRERVSARAEIAERQGVRFIDLEHGINMLPDVYVMAEPPRDVAEGHVVIVNRDEESSRQLKLSVEHEGRSDFKLWLDAHAAWYWRRRGELYFLYVVKLNAETIKLRPDYVPPVEDEED